MPIILPDSTKFDADSDRISTSRPELKKISDAVNTLATEWNNQGDSFGSDGIQEIVAGTGISVSQPDSAGAITITNTVTDTDTDTHVPIYEGFGGSATLQSSNPDSLRFQNDMFDCSVAGTADVQVSISSEYVNEGSGTACTSGGSYSLNPIPLGGHGVVSSAGETYYYYTQFGGSTGWTVAIKHPDGTTIHTTSASNTFVIVHIHKFSGGRTIGATLERGYLYKIYETTGSVATETIKFVTHYS
jgi:hypothetical protein